MNTSAAAAAKELYCILNCIAMFQLEMGERLVDLVLIMLYDEFHILLILFHSFYFRFYFILQLFSIAMSFVLDLASDSE